MAGVRAAAATMSGARPAASERVVSLDLLRGLAAFAVMVPHFFMYYLGEASDFAEVVSITAVEVFFVLSGFVLGPQIMLCARRRNWATLRTFLLRDGCGPFRPIWLHCWPFRWSSTSSA